MSFLFILITILFVLSSIFIIWFTFVNFYGYYGKEWKKETDADKKLKFAIVICAHNEEAVIGQLLDSIERLNYPENMYKTFVIADNCCDNTVLIADRHETITYERIDDSPHGKGTVLNWGINQINEDYPDRFDAVAVFDADNLVDVDFLNHINNLLVAGADVATGNRLTTNPFNTLLSSAYTIYWKMTTYLDQVPHYYMDIPCIISGTGFAFKMSALDDNEWNTQTVTEDVEFYIQQALKGNKVEISRDALFFDEQPEKISTMLRQMHRWCSGLTQIARSYTKTMIENRNDLKKIKLFDLFVSMYLSISIGTLTLCTLATMLLLIMNGHVWIALLMLVLTYLSQVGIGVIACCFRKKELDKFRNGILFYPLFIMGIGLISLYSMILPQQEWKSIPHENENVIEDMEKFK